MIRLPEDAAKRWLREQGIPVPSGEAADTPESAFSVASRFGDRVVVKALIPAGRRGKASAVIPVASPQAAADATLGLLGRMIDGHRVDRVYVEQMIPISTELFLSFTFDRDGPCVMLCARGGVEIETIVATSPDSLVERSIDPRRGLEVWHALDLWFEAGVRGRALRELASVTSRLCQVFRSADAEMLEVNPLAIDAYGRVLVVGAMVGLDASAVARHPEWPAVTAAVANPRERRVAEVDASVPGGECRYVELDGDIGLLVGGGGAGLYQHDRLVAIGAKPANHCVTPPTGTDSRKLKAVIEAVLDNPRVRALLVGFNFAQMARADIRVRSLLEVLGEKRIDTARLPVVIRLFGAGEAEARAAVAGHPHIHYMTREATLDDAVRLTAALARSAMIGAGS